MPNEQIQAGPGLDAEIALRLLGWVSSSAIPGVARHIHPAFSISALQGVRATRYAASGHPGDNLA